jgi:hypothetical protein
MKKIFFASFFVILSFLTSCGREDTPEPQQIVGTWRFEQVKTGATIDFCPEDVTNKFRDVLMVFTPDVVHIKDATSNQIIVSGTWESQNVPVYMGEDVSYQLELTTHFPTLVNDHDFSWRKVRYSWGKNWISLRSCQTGACYRYEMKRAE